MLGGTFDPVHYGHIGIAEAVLNELDLEVVVFVVAADQWLRPAPPVASADDRLEMAMSAVENTREFVVSDVDITRIGPTYTVDTLNDLRKWLGGGVELFLIVGADSALSMHRWDSAEAITSLARGVVVGRPGVKFDGRSLPESHPARGAEYVEGPMADVSANAIRDRVRGGDSLVGYVPQSVASYIEDEGLYR